MTKPPPSLCFTYLTLVAAACTTATETPAQTSASAQAAGAPAPTPVDSAAREKVLAAIPESWQRYDTKCGFAFYGPPTLNDDKVQGFDSCAVSYSGDGCSYGFDYGSYSGNLSGSFRDRPNHEEEAITIDGVDAILVSFGPYSPLPAPYFAGVHIPSFPWASATKLTVTAWCETLDGATNAKQVFETMAFERS